MAPSFFFDGAGGAIASCLSFVLDLSLVWFFFCCFSLVSSAHSFHSLCSSFSLPAHCHNGSGPYVHVCARPCLSSCRWARLATDIGDRTNVLSVPARPVCPCHYHACVTAKRLGCLRRLAHAAGSHLFDASTRPGAPFPFREAVHVSNPDPPITLLSTVCLPMPRGRIGNGSAQFTMSSRPVCGANDVIFWFRVQHFPGRNTPLLKSRTQKLKLTPIHHSTPPCNSSLTVAASQNQNSERTPRRKL